MRIIRPLSLAAVVLVVAAVSPDPVQAQAARTFGAPSTMQSPDAVPAVAAVPAGARAVSAGPRLDATRAGAPAVVASAARTPAPMRKADTPRSRMLMIVGGAALVGGAIIGDDVGTIVMLGGLGVGLYGLYLYLQ